MVALARSESTNVPLSLATVSMRSGVSRRYLEQLAASLKNAGLIRGQAGRGGGYVLAKDAEDILVSEIVVATSGPIDFASCISDAGNCIRHEFCECRPLWALVNHSIDQVLSGYSLEDLVDKERWELIRERADALDECGDRTVG